MNKDVYEYMLYWCDDMTIANAIMANERIYRNREAVYERIMKRKYLGSEKWKNEDMSWNDYFIVVSNFVAILKRRFDIPYFDGLNPKKFYLQVRDRTDRDIQILATHEAIKASNLNMVKLFVSRIGDMTNVCGGCIGLAIRVDKLEIVKYFLENFSFSHDGEINYLACEDYLACEAISLHRLDIFHYLLDKGANNFNLFLLEASYASNLPIVKLAINKGATSIHSAIDHVTDPEIEKYLRSLIA